MAQPITIKKKILTVKTMNPTQSLSEAAAGDESAAQQATAPVVTPSVEEKPEEGSAEKPVRKGIPFLISLISAILCVICFIVIIVFQILSKNDLSLFCNDQTGSGIPTSSSATEKAPPAPAGEAKPAPAAEAKPPAEPATDIAPAPAAAGETPAPAPSVPAAPENK